MYSTLYSTSKTSSSHYDGLCEKALSTKYIKYLYALSSKVSIPRPNWDPPTSSPQASVSSPRAKGGGPNSDDWRKSLVLWRDVLGSTSKGAEHSQRLFLLLKTPFCAIGVWFQNLFIVPLSIFAWCKRKVSSRAVCVVANCDPYC